MIKVTVLYPAQPGCKFDMSYYCEKHIPMVKRMLGSACTRTAAEQGISGADPDSTAPFVAMGHLYFDSVEQFHAAFDPHAEAILADVANYTDTTPVFQISDVKID
ncbi:EthD family reductase [Bradyrhizobium liaoningense]